MIKYYQCSWSSIKSFVKLLSHCYHNDKAVKMGELHIFLEAPISIEKATDILLIHHKSFMQLRKTISMK